MGRYCFDEARRRQKHLIAWEQIPSDQRHQPKSLLSTRQRCRYWKSTKKTELCAAFLKTRPSVGTSRTFQGSGREISSPYPTWMVFLHDHLRRTARRTNGTLPRVSVRSFSLSQPANWAAVMYTLASSSGCPCGKINSLTA